MTATEQLGAASGAPENQPPSNIHPPTPAFNQGLADSGKTHTAEDIEKARKEEHAKLYPQLEEERKKAKEAQEALEKIQAKNEARKVKIRETEKAKDMDAKEYAIQTRAELEQQLAKERAARAAMEELFQKERAYQEMQSYKYEQAQRYAEQVPPSLLKLLTGPVGNTFSTREEVDTFLQELAAGSSELTESFRSIQGDQQRSQPGVGLDTGQFESHQPLVGQQGEITAEQIAQMSAKQYGQYRDQLMGNRGRTSERGLFD